MKIANQLSVTPGSESNDEIKDYMKYSDLSFLGLDEPNLKCESENESGKRRRYNSEMKHIQDRATVAEGTKNSRLSSEIKSECEERENNTRNKEHKAIKTNATKLRRQTRKRHLQKSKGDDFNKNTDSVRKRNDIVQTRKVHARIEMTLSRMDDSKIKRVTKSTCRDR